MPISRANKGGKFLPSGRDLVRVDVIKPRKFEIVDHVAFQNCEGYLSQPDLGKGQLASIWQQSHSCVRDLTKTHCSIVQSTTNTTVERLIWH